MFKNLIKTVFGDPNQKEIKKLTPLVDQVATLEPEMQGRSDDDIQQMMAQFRTELREKTAEQRAEMETLQQTGH